MRDNAHLYAAADEMLAALKELVAWRDAKGPKGSGHTKYIDTLYDMARVAINKAEARPEPCPIVSLWRVEGTVHLAGGFSVIVRAADRDEAERKAKASLQEYDRPPVEWGVELQEACINGAWRDE